MEKILNSWRAFLNSERPIKEMHHIDAMFLPSEFLDSLPEEVKDLALKYDVLDFGLEKIYKQIPTKFFVPYSEGKRQFFDFSESDDHRIARQPTDKELNDSSIPTLPKDWYVRFLEHFGKKEKVQETKWKDTDLSSVKTLAVFDFDDTLFKSTDVSKRMKTDSHLSPNSLPKNPKDSDWNLDVVYKAQELCANPSVYCVMMTGRIGDVFEDAINTLLQNKNILFAETHFNEFGGDTAQYKKDTIYKIIDKLPNVKNLIMWEDQEDKAKDYTEEFSDKISFKLHLVPKDNKR